ncbi:MAG: AI-2E family transporter [Chloroflexota bacterium]|nr:AI-2E family transporter [Chloroflexota bacterium]
MRRESVPTGILLYHAGVADLLAAGRRHRLGIFTAAAIVVVVWILWTARGALPAFVIGLALALVLDPGVTALQRRGLPRWSGVLAMYAAVVALFWVIFAFAVPPLASQITEFAQHLPELGDRASQLQRALNEWYEGLAIPPGVRGALDSSIATARQTIGDAVSGLVAPFAAALFWTAAFVLGLLIIPIWLFFVLKDRDRLPDAIALALPPTWRADGRSVLGLLGRVGGRWVRGQLLLGASIFAATAIGLTALTLLGFGELGRFTLVLALIAGVLEWFPIIGPVVAAIPALLIALTISPAAVLAILALYIAIQQLENNLLVPKVMGDAIELHPAVMILALVVGGALFGFWGAVLAAPVVAAGRDLYRYTFLRLSGDVPELAFQLVNRGAGPGPRSEGVVTVAATDASESVESAGTQPADHPADWTRGRGGVRGKRTARARNG